MKYKARVKTILRTPRKPYGVLAGYIGIVVDEQKNIVAETPMYGLRGDAYKAAVAKMNEFISKGA